MLVCTPCVPGYVSSFIAVLAAIHSPCTLAPLPLDEVFDALRRLRARVYQKPSNTTSPRKGGLFDVCLSSPALAMRTCCRRPTPRPRHRLRPGRCRRLPWLCFDIWGQKPRRGRRVVQMRTMVIIVLLFVATEFVMIAAVHILAFSLPGPSVEGGSMDKSDSTRKNG